MADGLKCLAGPLWFVLLVLRLAFSIRKLCWRCQLATGSWESCDHWDWTGQSAASADVLAHVHIHIRVHVPCICPISSVPASRTLVQRLRLLLAPVASSLNSHTLDLSNEFHMLSSISVAGNPSHVPVDSLLRVASIDALAVLCHPSGCKLWNISNSNEMHV